MFRTLRAGDDLATQRRQIIEDINQKVKALHLDVTLVFDSQYQASDSERLHYDSLEIQYTSHGETADDFILTALKRAPQPQTHTVVTSDKRLAWLARRRLAKTESVEDFKTWLTKRYKNKLRQSKEGKEVLKSSEKEEMRQKQLIAQREAAKRVPTNKTLAEDCFDFYLENFESAYQEIQKKEKPPEAPPGTRKPKPTPKKSKVSTPEDPEEKAASEMERWLNLFQKKSKQEK